VKQNATLDSSFWINAIAGGLIDHLLADFELCVVPAVARELTVTYPGGARLHQLIAEGRLTLRAPQRIALERFGPGEREAISMAIEHRDWILLIDDLRPFRAAADMGLAPVSTPAYAASLYSRRVLDEVGALTALARLAARGTVSPQLIALALTQIGTTLRERR
jgi:predicted nucleic acid-binding protein